MKYIVAAGVTARGTAAGGRAAGPPPSPPARRLQQQRPGAQDAAAQRARQQPPPLRPTTQQQQQQRQQQQGQQGQQQRPGTGGVPRCLVVVEGPTDRAAVQRAVPGVDVYVLHSATMSSSSQVQQELAAAAARYPAGLVVLTDPDVAGRQARRTLDEALPGACLHAFLPSPLATADAATRNHEAGNVGVEHAAPAVVRAALAAPRRSHPGRKEFSRQDLLGWGLVAELHERGGGVTARRFAVGAFLGLGDCDGKQLLAQLNRYGFTRQEVGRALAWAEAQLAPGQRREPAAQPAPQQPPPPPQQQQRPAPPSQQQQQQPAQRTMPPLSQQQQTRPQVQRTPPPPVRQQERRPLPQGGSSGGARKPWDT